MSQQPRTVALPTERTNDSRLANSQWGAQHNSHYSGERVGPGQYERHHTYRHGYKAVFNGHGNTLLVNKPFHSNMATRKKIVAMVRKSVPHNLGAMTGQAMPNEVNRSMAAGTLTWDCVLVEASYFLNPSLTLSEQTLAVVCHAGGIKVQVHGNQLEHCCQDKCRVPSLNRPAV